jgi:hypothetical protein
MFGDSFDTIWKEIYDPESNILYIHFTSNQGGDDICIRISITDNSISQRLEATELSCYKGINSNRQPY